MEDGTVLIAYRDRTPDEICDISIVRRRNGVWSGPVNGPAIDAPANDAVNGTHRLNSDGTPATLLRF